MPNGSEMSRTPLGAGDAIHCSSRDKGGGAAVGGANEKVTRSRLFRRSGAPPALFEGHSSSNISGSIIPSQIRVTGPVIVAAKF